ncbi:PAS domain-containing sensor histidine kinase [Pelomonas sp. SE-A7]|uniref:PAS domain-containing sensor histidine kinase n=1 Tax=Pelomonas sp. SE-A7 TaxID=3054953 RepID=UPI00259CE504|nr:PAS domain-containing sensor histidine kinase [Pelomonas sp. SE-A7]MDM4767262.1 PAS domain-containing sensor histidine kinase [Pelomonas sp. SE-A7]
MDAPLQPPEYNYLDKGQGYRRFVVWLHRALLLIVLLTLVGALLVGFQEWPGYVYLAATVGLVLLSQWVLRRRGPEASTGLLAAGLWLIISLSLLQFAGIYGVNLLAYPFLVGLAGWVLGKRWLLGMTAVSVSWLLMLGLGAHLGWLPPTPRTPALLVTLQALSLLVVCAALVHAAHRSLASSRDEALRLSDALSQRHAEVQARERQLAQLIDAVPAGVASFDGETRMRRCNPRYAALYGKRPEQLVGLRVVDFVHEDVLPQVQPHWAKALVGQTVRFRRSNRDPSDGSVSWLDVSLVPELHEGQVVGMFALLVDVTAQVHAERAVMELNAGLEQRVEQRSAELAEANERLEQTQRELQEAQSRATLSVLVAKMSHELASPVGNSRLLADTFLHWIRDFEQELDQGQVRRSSLNKLLADLRSGAVQMQLNLAGADSLMRDFKQLSADQASGQRRRFDLATLVGEVMASLGPALRRSGHRVRLDLPEGVAMDSLPGPLGQVLINLVNNALIHAFEGRSHGEILISAQLLDGPDQGRVELRVADNGKGIAAEALPELFKPFYSTKIGQGGSGLGLPIVEDIVCKRLGGSISVSSEPGRGSCFTLRLPLRLLEA